MRRERKKISSAEDPRKEFCRSYLPLLKAFMLDPEMCNYFKGIFKIKGESYAGISMTLTEMCKQAYEQNLVNQDYGQIIENHHLDKRLIAQPTLEWARTLSEQELLACIAWHYRADHFSEGSLLCDSVPNGYLYNLYTAYVEK